MSGTTSTSGSAPETVPEVEATRDGARGYCDGLLSTGCECPWEETGAGPHTVRHTVHRPGCQWAAGVAVTVPTAAQYVETIRNALALARGQAQDDECGWEALVDVIDDAGDALAALASRLEQAEQALRSCASAAGHPDADEGCRNVIAIALAGLVGGDE